MHRTPVFAERRTPGSRSVIVCREGRAPNLEAGLASVAASAFSDVELLILVDASDEVGGLTALSFLHDHPSVAGHAVPATDLPRSAYSRNALVGRARGEYLLLLDSGTGVYPSALQRLVTALDGDPSAVFSYPMIAVFDADEPVELLSSLPWEPERLERETGSTRSCSSGQSVCVNSRLFNGCLHRRPRGLPDVVQDRRRGRSWRARSSGARLASAC